jgi:ElaB/YqjD/DUF883 family membrane-anchored ribosome-binding protein
MENQNESILRQMEETRTSLTEKVEAIEELVSDKVRAGAEVVEHATDVAHEIVSDVKETVHEVTETVGQTVKSVASAFDLSRQTERHPWVVLGVSAVAGCVLGNYLVRRAHRRKSAHEARRARLVHARGGNGASHAEPARPARGTGAERPREKGWFTEHLQHLKGLAISALLGAVRDMARRAVPGEVGARLAAEVDSLTTHLGGEPIRGSVLGEKSQEWQGSERTESPPGEAATNRLLSGGSGLR